MFDKKFIEEIFKPQEIYSRRIMRTFFEKIAHSSIMRLNETRLANKYKFNSVMEFYSTISIISNLKSLNKCMTTIR